MVVVMVGSGLCWGLGGAVWLAGGLLWGTVCRPLGVVVGGLVGLLRAALRAASSGRVGPSFFCPLLGLNGHVFSDGAHSGVKTDLILPLN